MVAMLFVFVAAGPMLIFGLVRYARGGDKPKRAMPRRRTEKRADTKENESQTQDSIATLKKDN